MFPIMYLIVMNGVPTTFFIDEAEVNRVASRLKSVDPLLSITVHKCLIMEMVNGKKKTVVMVYDEE